MERTKTIPDGGVERAVLLAGREVYLCVFELFAVCGMKKVVDKCPEEEAEGQTQPTGREGPLLLAGSEGEVSGRVGWGWNSETPH